MQKVNKEEKEAEGGGCGRARQGVRAAAAARASVRTRAPWSKGRGGGRARRAALVANEAGGGKRAQKGRSPRIVRARVVCNTPLYFAAASALFVKGVPVWLSQKAETPFLRRPCTAK